jgi:hypothetical protein
MNDPWIVFYHISEGTVPKSKAATITGKGFSMGEVD